MWQDQQLFVFIIVLFSTIPGGFAEHVYEISGIHHRGENLVEVPELEEEAVFGEDSGFDGVGGGDDDATLRVWIYRCCP